jgi:16S rRNA (guanine966-N2)-methyltransferase
LVRKAKSEGKRREVARGNDAARVAEKGGAGERAAQSRVLRIVAGRHRGRRLRFPEGVEIRPTPDRVRETLFNWLQQRIAGARVLDLFAGSGALGLEAISRGAAHVTFVEQSRRAAQAIEAVAREWQETSVSVACMDAIGWLAQQTSEAAPFNVVFLDPPYDADLLSRAAGALARPGILAPDARVYLERRARDVMPLLPDGWKELRAGRAGEVGYHLFAT